MYVLSVVCHPCHILYLKPCATDPRSDSFPELFLLCNTKRLLANLLSSASGRVHATIGVRSGMATGTTTRAAAQQQKLEEHLAVILQRLDMQKAESDQRIAEQDRVSQERHLQLQQLLQSLD